MIDWPKTNLFGWAIPAVLVLLLALLAMFGGVEPPQAPPRQSSYDASDQGVRAAYLLLEGLDYDVSQSRRLNAGKVRWVLFPTTASRESSTEMPAKGQGRTARSEAEALDRWVRDGGTLLLADDSPEFAGMLGLKISVGSDLSVADRIDDNDRPLAISAGFARIAPLDRPDRQWPETGVPLASIFRRGRGEIWIVQRPDILRNDRLREADNALAVCRLADITSRDRAERIYFDEYFHGLRERPGAMQLLFRPPVLCVTLHGLGVLALLLWRFLPRFGPLLASPPSRRRSKEEFLDAMAHLLTRKGAYEEAFAIVRDALARELEREFGLPAATSVRELAAHAARRRPGCDREKLARAIAGNTPPSGREEFLLAINELERIRREFFHE